MEVTNAVSCSMPSTTSNAITITAAQPMLPTMASKRLAHDICPAKIPMSPGMDCRRSIREAKESVGRDHRRKRFADHPKQNAVLERTRIVHHPPNCCIIANDNPPRFGEIMQKREARRRLDGFGSLSARARMVKKKLLPATNHATTRG